MLLSHLIPSFRDKPENIATLALEYVLTLEPVFAVFRAFLSAEFTWSGELHRVAAQNRFGQHGQPDLIGFDSRECVTLVIEVKFWAGLTKNQPGAYLNLLGPDGILLFLVPDSRVEVLRSQLKRDGRSDERIKIVSGRRLLASILASTNGASGCLSELCCDLLQMQSMWGGLRPYGYGTSTVR